MRLKDEINPGAPGIASYGGPFNLCIRTHVVLDNQPVFAGLAMDRSTPLGNTNGSDSRGRLHVFIKNESGESVPVSFDNPQTPFISNISAITPGTEYSHAFQPNVKKFLIRARGNSKVQFAFLSGESSTNFMTIWPGVTYQEDQIGPVSLTIYFQCSKADEILEVLEWF